MEISGKVLRRAWKKTVLEDRRTEVEEVKEIEEVKKQTKRRVWLSLRCVAKCRGFETELSGVLKSWREKTDCVACKTFGGWSAAAGRQIDLAPLRDAGGIGGRD
jgi:hypothetical protein